VGAYHFCVIGLFFIMVFTPSVTAADTMFRAGPLHTGIFDNSGIIPVNTSAWHFATESLVSSSPAVVNGIVFIGSDDKNLYAIDTGTGKEKWHFATGNGVSSSPAVVKGVVYVGSYDKNLYAIDALTGLERWRFTTGSSVSSSPTVSDGVVYIGSDDDYLHAIDVAVLSMSAVMTRTCTQSMR
jgi:outer membrane protein assembly factor BamB